MPAHSTRPDPSPTPQLNLVQDRQAQSSTKASTESPLGLRPPPAQPRSHLRPPVEPKPRPRRPATCATFPHATNKSAAKYSPPAVHSRANSFFKSSVSTTSAPTFRRANSSINCTRGIPATSAAFPCDISPREYQ